MQTLNFKTAGGFTRTWFNATTNAITAGPQWNARARKQHSQSSSGLVRGNFKLPNPWSYTVVRGDAYLNGSYHYVNRSWYPGNGFHDEGYGCASSGTCHSGNMYDIGATDPYNKALKKLYDSIRADVDLSIDIYQGSQTVRMVKNFAQAISHPIENFVQISKALLRKEKFRRGTGEISNRWLEWQYGLKPTMKTIYDLTHGLGEQIMDTNGFLLAKARASSVHRTDKRFAAGENSFISGAPYRRISSDSWRVEIALYYTISNLERNALSQFTSLNPVSFAYENVPYSFVLDWFVDVGGYLRSMETALMTGLEFKRGYKTVSRKLHGKVIFDTPFSPQPSVVVVPSLAGELEQVSCNRSLLYAMPLPNMPVWNPHLGTERLFSAASLLRGLLKR